MSKNKNQYSDDANAFKDKKLSHINDEKTAAEQNIQTSTDDLITRLNKENLKANEHMNDVYGAIIKKKQDDLIKVPENYHDVRADVYTDKMKASGALPDQLSNLGFSADSGLAQNIKGRYTY